MAKTKKVHNSTEGLVNDLRAPRMAQGYMVQEPNDLLHPGNIVALLGGGDDSTAALINVLKRMSRFVQEYGHSGEIPNSDAQVKITILYFDFGQSNVIYAAEVVVINKLIRLLNRATEKGLFQGLSLYVDSDIKFIEMPKTPTLANKQHLLSNSKNAEKLKNENASAHVVNHRNNQMVMAAAAFAEDAKIDAHYIILGTTTSVYSADCWPAAASAMQNCIIACSTKEYPPVLVTPYVFTEKTWPIIDIIKFTEDCSAVGLEFPKTFSCYAPEVIDEETYSCGKCLSCESRLTTHRKLAIRDNIRYVDESVKNKRISFNTRP
jgi:7-cyano-7-deazaguanine synthase in queuosine biosynthesis